MTESGEITEEVKALIPSGRKKRERGGGKSVSPIVRRQPSTIKPPYNPP